MHALDAGLLVNAASGVLMIALGAVVAAVGPGKRANRGFAVFALPFGAVWILENVWGPSADHWAPLALFAVGGLLALAAVGLATLASAYHAPADAGSRRHAAIALSVGTFLFFADAAFFLPSFGLDVRAPTPDLVDLLGFWSFHATAWGVLAFLALRFPAFAGRPREAVGLRLMSLALALYPAFFAARETVVALGVMAWPPAATAAGVLLTVAKAGGIAALWLRNAMCSDRPALERNLAWAVLAAALVGVPGLSFDPSLADSAFDSSANHPGFGIARTLGVVVLAYAILRHQLLGIDVKVRWGISRGTIAAAFVAAFFIASEGAQILFGQGNEWVGLMAAGALVFAIAPLQRAAERLAEKAVPVTSTGVAVPAAAPPRPGPDPEDAFRNAVRLAMRDRQLTPDERVHLAEVAETMGIGAGRAAALVHEAERERASEVVP